MNAFLENVTGEHFPHVLGSIVSCIDTHLACCCVVLCCVVRKLLKSGGKGGLSDDNSNGSGEDFNFVFATFSKGDHLGFFAGPNFTNLEL